MSTAAAAFTGGFSWFKTGITAGRAGNSRHAVCSGLPRRAGFSRLAGRVPGRRLGSGPEGYGLAAISRHGLPPDITPASVEMVVGASRSRSSCRGGVDFLARRQRRFLRLWYGRANGGYAFPPVRTPLDVVDPFARRVDYRQPFVGSARLERVLGRRALYRYRCLDRVGFLPLSGLNTSQSDWLLASRLPLPEGCGAWSECSPGRCRRPPNPCSSRRWLKSPGSLTNRSRRQRRKR